MVQQLNLSNVLSHDLITPYSLLIISYLMRSHTWNE